MTIGNDTFTGTDFGDSITADQGDDTLIGGLGEDSYIFDTSLNYGHNHIIDNDGILVIDAAVPTINATKTSTDGVYIHQEGSDYYVLTRTNDSGVLDLTGDNLTLTINSTIDTASSSITIDDYDFDNGAFGITLNDPISNTIIVNEILNTVNKPYSLNVVAVEDGKALALWSQKIGSELTIGLQLLDQYGEKIGNNKTLDHDTSYLDGVPIGTLLSNGNVAISWLGYDLASSSFDVHGQVVTSEGDPVSESFTVNTNTYEDQKFHDITALDNGEFYITWYDEGASGDETLPNEYALKGQRFDATGTKIGTETVLFDLPELTNLRVDNATLSNGNVISILNSIISVETVVSAPDGTIINSISSTLDTSLHSSNFATRQTVASTLDNDTTVLAFNYDSSTEDDIIGIQLLDATGARLGAEITLASNIFNPTLVDITTLQDNSSLIFWTQGTTAVTGLRELVYQKIDSTGQLVGDVTVIIPEAEWLRSRYVDAQTLSNGNILVLWQDDVATPADVHTLLLDADGNIAPGTPAYLPIFGTDGTDILSGTTENDIIIANEGNDTLNGDSGDDILDGGEGDDTAIFAGDIADYTITANGTDFDISSNDTTSPETDTLVSIENLIFDDGTLVFDGTGYVEGASNTAPTIDNPLADQTVNVNQSFNFIIPTASFGDVDGDTLTYSATLSNGDPLPSWLSLSTDGTFTGTPDVASFENDLTITVTADDGNGGTVTDDFVLSVGSTILGTANADTLEGTSVTDTILANEGDDLVNGGAANDTIDGGNGNDTLNGDDGDDLITDGDDSNVDNQFKDELSGGAGNDTLIAGNGKDTLNGNDGNDILTGGGNTDIFVFDFEAGATDTITDFNTSEDYIDISGEGFDHLVFFSDLTLTDIAGGVEVDLGGHTLILEGVTAQQLDYTHFEGLVLEDENQTIRGTHHDDNLSGGSGDDYISGRRGDDTLHGQAGDDFIRGGLGKDEIFGYAGDDFLLGGYHNDTVDGGAGNDYISGGIGSDILIGGLGQDILNGGWGKDTFVFNSLDDSTDTARDVIQDFSYGTGWCWWFRSQNDSIDLSNIGSINGINDLNIYHDGNKTVVEDINSDFAFELNGILSLNESNFIF